MPDGRYMGLYRGMVMNTRDPDERGRCQVMVTGVHDFSFTTSFYDSSLGTARSLKDYGHPPRLDLQEIWTAKDGNIDPAHEDDPAYDPVGGVFPWAEVINAAGRGFSRAPVFHVGDLVWVVFEHGFAEQPVIVGSISAWVWGQDDVPPENCVPTYETARRRWAQTDRWGNLHELSEVPTDLWVRTKSGALWETADSADDSWRIATYGTAGGWAPQWSFRATDYVVAANDVILLQTCGNYRNWSLESGWSPLLEAPHIGIYSNFSADIWARDEMAIGQYCSRQEDEFGDRSEYRQTRLVWIAPKTLFLGLCSQTPFDKFSHLLPDYDDVYSFQRTQIVKVEAYRWITIRARKEGAWPRNENAPTGLVGIYGDTEVEIWGRRRVWLGGYRDDYTAFQRSLVLVTTAIRNVIGVCIEDDCLDGITNTNHFGSDSYPLASPFGGEPPALTSEYTELWADSGIQIRICGVNQFTPSGGCGCTACEAFDGDDLTRKDVFIWGQRVIIQAGNEDGLLFNPGVLRVQDHDVAFNCRLNGIRFGVGFTVTGLNMQPNPALPNRCAAQIDWSGTGQVARIDSNHGDGGMYNGTIMTPPATHTSGDLAMPEAMTAGAACIVYHLPEDGLATHWLKLGTYVHVTQVGTSAHGPIMMTNLGDARRDQPPVLNFAQSDAAYVDAWDRETDDGPVTVNVICRVVYNPATRQVLLAYGRPLTFDASGRLASIGAEYEVSVTTPVLGCTT